MFAVDRATIATDYWSSRWPVECGSNRRQKSAIGRLDAASGTASVTARHTGSWDVMAVWQDPGQWNAGGTTSGISGHPPYGWVEKFDPVTLEPLAVFRAAMRHSRLVRGNFRLCERIDLLRQWLLPKLRQRG